MAEDGWYPDPTERFEFRWLANDEWTNSVWQDGGAQSDPYEAPTTPATPTAVNPSQTIGRAEAFAFASPAESAPPAPIEPTPPAAAAPAAPFAPVPPPAPWPSNTVGPPSVSGKQRLRTGVPGPVAWAAVFLSTPGLITFLYGIAALFLANAIDDFNNDFGDDSDFGNDASNSVAGVGVVMLAIGGFYLAVAVCLMMAMPWARIAGIVLGGIHALFSLLALSQATETGLILLIISALQIYLLCTPTAIQLFKTREVGMGEVPSPLRG